MRSNGKHLKGHKNGNRRGQGGQDPSKRKQNLNSTCLTILLHANHDVKLSLIDIRSFLVILKMKEKSVVQSSTRILFVMLIYS